MIGRIIIPPHACCAIYAKLCETEWTIDLEWNYRISLCIRDGTHLHEISGSLKKIRTRSRIKENENGCENSCTKISE